MIIYILFLINNCDNVHYRIFLVINFDFILTWEKKQVWFFQRFKKYCEVEKNYEPLVYLLLQQLSLHLYCAKYHEIMTLFLNNIKRTIKLLIVN
jgi:hypothetical protein